MPAMSADHCHPFTRLLGVGVLCLGLISGPLTVDVETWEVTSKEAFAKKGGDKGGGKGGDKGGGKGGGKDRGDRGDRGSRSERSVGSDREARGQGRSQRSLGEVFDSVRSGKAFGFNQKDRRIERAKDRYGQGPKAERSRRGGVVAGDPDAARVAHRFSANETGALIGRGWKSDQPMDGFVNHGDRVRTMVELAKALGYSASVGALQANFGTPAETGIAALQEELAAARAEAETDPDAATRVDELEAELAAAIRDAKPGQGPAGDWAIADLDVNDDGIVDRADLAALGDIREEEEDSDSDAGDEASEDDDQEEEGEDTLAEVSPD